MNTKTLFQPAVTLFLVSVFLTKNVTNHYRAATMMLSRRAVPALRQLVHPTRRLLHAPTAVSSQRLNGIPSLEDEPQTDIDSGFLQGEVSETMTPGSIRCLPHTHDQQPFELLVGSGQGCQFAQGPSGGRGDGAVRTYHHRVNARLLAFGVSFTRQNSHIASVCPYHGLAR